MPLEMFIADSTPKLLGEGEMIVVTINLASARTGAVSTLGRMFIWNKATHKPGDTKYNYGFAIRHKKHLDYKQGEQLEAHSTAVGNVDNYSADSYSVWKLVWLCLQSAFGRK